MDGFSHRLSLQKNRNLSDPSLDSISRSDARIDSATNLHGTVHPSPTDNDSGGPSDSTCIASASTAKHATIGDASLDNPGYIALYNERAMPDVQDDNHRPARNCVATELILSDNLPSIDGSTEASVNNHHSTVHMHQNGLSIDWTLGKLKKASAHWEEQLELYEKLIKNVAAGGTRGMSTDRSVKESFEHIDELTEENNRIIQNVKSEIDRTNNEQTHVVEHQEQAAEREREAKTKPLFFIADGTKSAVYKIPETFGKLVIEVGPLTAVKQELLNILRIRQVWDKVNHSIRSGSRPHWLRQLLLPRVSKFVPTGWTGDIATGLVRPCENLDPRIPGFYDAGGNRISIDCDEQAGIVLSQIGGLTNDDLRRVLERCYGLKKPEVNEVLNSNDHCVIRIYLGRRSFDGWLDNAGDSVSDENSTTTTSDDEPLSTMNLPAYIDHIIKYYWKRAGQVLADFAREIAFGYAVLHWGARLDGRGIEFLLGSYPARRGKQFYMLDFEDCRPFDVLNARCARDQLVPAALENDPYIPRAVRYRPNCSLQFWEREARDYWDYEPTSFEDYTWLAFVKNYLEASHKICEAFNRNFDPHMPKLFIEELMRGFLGRQATQDASGSPAGDSENPVASKDGNHDQKMQENDDGTEQGGSSNQQDPVHVGDDAGGQSQDESDSFENDQYGANEYDSDPMNFDDSSEGEEDSDEDDDEDED